jgi:PAB-dependent poly(A)-specific ribonuclease subunit 2
MRLAVAAALDEVDKRATVAGESQATRRSTQPDEDGFPSGQEEKTVPVVEPQDLAATYDSEEYQWFSWNDFALLPVSEDDVRRAHTEWKRPCVALYMVDGLGEKLRHVPSIPSMPIASAATLSADFSLTDVPPNYDERMLAFTPLSSSEVPPRKGALVAIDAEFVAVTREVTRLNAKGRTVVVKPARLALARVSCVRGQGPMEGVPFIDSYIQQAEPVIDYLTRYSGLQPGDLDPSISRHHVCCIL